MSFGNLLLLTQTRLPYKRFWLFIMWGWFFSTYGFILTVEDLSPNIGVLWWVQIYLWYTQFKLITTYGLMSLICCGRYFFAEVFEFFRNFFLIVFHVNILFMILPLAIRLRHRPCYLAFVYVAICSMLKSYPSVSSLYLFGCSTFTFFLRNYFMKIWHATPSTFDFSYVLPIHATWAK